MKKIHDILKSRKKHLHVTHTKKPLHTDFHSPISSSGLSLFCKRDKNKQARAVLPSIIEQDKKDQDKRDKTAPRYSAGSVPTMRFFRPKKEKENEREGGGKGGSGRDKLDKERMARLRELLSDVIDHPGTLTPHMFWALFMKIAPHFSLTTAGCVRVSALFWLMLSYIKAKNKTKKRKLKDQLTEAAELLEKEGDDAVIMVRAKKR